MFSLVAGLTTSDHSWQQTMGKKNLLLPSLNSFLFGDDNAEDYDGVRIEEKEDNKGEPSSSKTQILELSELTQGIIDSESYVCL